MKLFRIDYRLQSAAASEWQADTIFGHLCWAMRYSEGEAALAKFLDSFRQGHPLILVSNGFPQGLFPNPKFPPRPIDASLPPKQQREKSKRRKDAQKQKYLTMDDFNLAINGQDFEPSKDSKLDFQKRVTLKNQINRLTGTTGLEGSLFDFEETFCPAISIYAKIDDDFVETARELFGFIRDGGYGKRKSVGYGAISSMSFMPLEGLRLPEKPNGFVSLSNFVPASSDPTRGYWDTVVKYGKLGEEYASAGNPFKRPLVMLVAGSTFYDSPVRPFYGRMVPEVSPTYRHVVQCGFALPLPIRLPPVQ